MPPSPSLSLILPANNEAQHIDLCLRAVLTSDTDMAGPVQVIVVPNGCTDDTAAKARRLAPEFAAKGWTLEVVELEQGSKIAALSAGESAAAAPVLAYLDADVALSPAVLSQTVMALSAPAAAYASGEVRLSKAQSWTTRAYGRFYMCTPFMRQDAPGCGYFAMTAQGRGRWGPWPQIISDDTFARLNFTSSERVQIAAHYDWPLVEGLFNLIRVRRRQNAGVDEIGRKYPELLNNDAKTRFTLRDVARAAMRYPLGFLVYAAVTIAVKLSPGAANDWRRGR